MKVSKFSTLTSIFFAVLVDQTWADGILDCTVKQQAIHEMVEGQPKRFSGYENGVEVGENLIFRYAADKKGGLLFVLDYPTKDLTESGWEYKNVRTLDSGSKLYVVDMDEVFGLHFSEDKISLKGLSNRLVLKRYYKSDYQGMLVAFYESNLSTHVIGLDCRTIRDGFQEIFETFE